ncbi:MAG: tetratricopeptide (TPR) repeat protein [Rhodothermales bacterium]
MLGGGICHVLNALIIKRAGLAPAPREAMIAPGLNRKILCLSVLMLVSVCSFAHVDLELQIEEINSRIELEGPHAELFLKRGNLYRRHEDWDKAASDFKRVRELEPGHPQIDWLEGLYKIDSKQWQKGDELLSRYLESNQEYGPAYHVRALARWKLGSPAAAAKDYGSAIYLSNQPSPSLYRAQVISLYTATPDDLEEASAVVDAGLNRFPREISLMGLGVDLALVQSDVRHALQYMMRLPSRLDGLLQWKFRRASWACINKDRNAASSGFKEVLSNVSEKEIRRAGTFDLSIETVSALAEAPEPEKCIEAINSLLHRLEP